MDEQQNNAKKGISELLQSGDWSTAIINCE
ncbi:MAG: hypothetical protein ACTS8R_08825 [Arsenophonus sp. NC-QC1-MAG3]